MANYKHTDSKINLSQCAPSEASAAQVARGDLGIYANYPTPPQQVDDFITLVDESTGELICLKDGVKVATLADKFSLRYRRQTEARKVLYGFNTDVVLKANGHNKHHATCSCNYVPYSKDIDLLKNPYTERFNLSGLSTCGSAAVCPICESVISERRGNELRTVFNQAIAMGLCIQLLTFTFPHTIEDEITDLRPKLSEAQQRFFNGSPWKRCVDKYGIKAYCRSLECRFGTNGWHPHFHFIVFSEHPLPKTKLLDQTSVSNRWRKLDINQQSDDWLWFLNRWQMMCEKVGLQSPNEYGLDIRDGSKAYDYVVKYGSDGQAKTTKNGKVLTWDMADEMTKGNKKNGKDSLSPFQLLDLIGDDDAPKDVKKFYRHEFLQYARAMKGVPLLRWSKSAFDVFVLDERTDTELLLEENKVSILFAKISIFEWRCILKHSSRDDFMDVVNSGAPVEAVTAWISQWVELEKSDRESLPEIDTPIEEHLIITSGLSNDELVDISNDLRSRVASSVPSQLSLLPDEIGKALVTRKAPFTKQMYKDMRTLKNRRRLSALERAYENANDEQRKLSQHIEETQAMNRLLNTVKR
ncbi:hypothetical protein LH710_004419 [Vibrio vulnificus]|nr:hypothetical protein [Vibrio vulnificus]